MFDRLGLAALLETRTNTRSWEIAAGIDIKYLLSIELSTQYYYNASLQA